DDDTGDRIGDAHQRRMQRRGDAPYHVIPDKDGENKDGELEDKGRAGRRRGMRLRRELLRQNIEVVCEAARVAGGLTGLLGDRYRICHQFSVQAAEARASAAGAGRSTGFTTAPFSVSNVALTISSPESILSPPSLSTRSVRKFSKLRA